LSQATTGLIKSCFLDFAYLFALRYRAKYLLKSTNYNLMKLNKKLLASAVSLLLVNSSQSFAAGYSTALYSTSGLANSYAGSAAGIHDISDMFFNPATISDFKEKQFIASVSYLKLKIDADNANGKFSNGFPNSGSDTHDAGGNAFIPAFYLSAPINDSTTFGLSVTSPFGLSTKYNKDWVGRYRAIESSITTSNINPSLSYKFNDQLSVGAGLQAQYYQATFTKAVVNIGDPYNASSDFLGKASGSGWGYGYNLGANYKVSDRLKFGIGYRSKIDYKLTGKTQVAGYNFYSNFNAKTSTPESLTAGTAFKLNDAVELAYDVTWTRWSRLKSLSINAFQDSNLSGTTTFNWHDSFLHSVGANFKANDKWLVRTGVAYEKDAVTASSREPMVPSGDRVWTSVGFNYKVSQTLSLDATYLHQFYRVAKVNLTDSTTSVNAINANYKTKVDVISLAVKKEF
jgi:long-chain fatty acid transport protein